MEGEKSEDWRGKKRMNQHRAKHRALMATGMLRTSLRFAGVVCEPGLGFDVASSTQPKT